MKGDFVKRVETTSVLEGVLSPLTPKVPDKHTIEFAATLLRELGSILVLDTNKKSIEVQNPIIFQLFKKMLFDLSQGRAVSIVPYNAELTTHQAAHILNVSRPHLIKILDEGKISHRMVGTHRRILFQDLMSYLEQHKINARKALDELTQFSEKHGPYKLPNS